MKIKSYRLFPIIITAVILSVKAFEGYAAIATIQLGGPGFTPVYGDYDGDGKIDPAVYQEATGDWFVGQSSNSYAVGTVNLGTAGCTPVAGDFDQDGKADPAVYQESTGNWYARLSGSGYAISWMNFGGSGYLPVPGDYDGCGTTETAVYAPASGIWYLYRPDQAVTMTNHDTYLAVYINYNVDTRYNIGALYAQKTLAAVPEFEFLADAYLHESAVGLHIQDTNITAAVLLQRAWAIEPQIASLYLEELNGFASVLSGGTNNVLGDGKLSRDELLMLNLCPDIFTTVSCSGIAVFGQRSATGQTIIGRNLDWYLGSNGKIGRFNAVIYSLVGQTRICSIGYLGVLGCLTGLNDAGVYAASIYSDVNATYSAVGKRSWMFDLRYVLESEQTLSGASAFIGNPTNQYAFHNVLYLADKYESRMLENDYEHRRSLRGYDSILNTGVTWGFDNAIAVVNSFVLNGNTDNHTAAAANYMRWNNYRSQLAARGNVTAFDDVKAIMAYHDTGGEGDGDIYHTGTAMSMVYAYADNHLVVFFHAATNAFTENPQYINVPVGFTP